MSEKAKQRRLNRVRRPLPVNVVDDPFEKQLAYVAEVSKNARTTSFCEMKFYELKSSLKCFCSLERGRLKWLLGNGGA